MMQNNQLSQAQVDLIRVALSHAFILGQNYWADADSSSYSANKRSDETKAKFEKLKQEICDTIQSVCNS